MELENRYEEVIDLLDSGKNFVLSEDDFESISVSYVNGKYLVLEIDWITFLQCGFKKSIKATYYEKHDADKLIRRSLEIQKNKEDLGRM